MRKNDKTNWERRLAGDVVPLTADCEPDYGFYRVKSRDKTMWRAVAYWYADGALRCHLNGRDVDEQRAKEMWTWASQHPITYEVYKLVTAGGQWPDLNLEVTRSNQAPPDNSFEGLQERIDDIGREAERLIKAGAAKSQDAADQAADVANKLAELWNKADAERKREKQPHLDASRAVDDRWRPMLVAAEVYARLKDVVCKPWLAAQKKAKEAAEAEARRLANEKAAEARRLQEEADARLVEASASGSAVAVAEARRQAASVDAAKAEAAIAKQVADNIAASTVTVGTRGRGVHLRSKIVVTIEDRAAVLAFFQDREEITEALQKMAEKAIGAGIKVPGIKVDKDSRAA